LGSPREAKLKRCGVDKSGVFGIIVLLFLFFKKVSFSSENLEKRRSWAKASHLSKNRFPRDAAFKPGLSPVVCGDSSSLFLTKRLR